MKIKNNDLLVKWISDISVLKIYKEKTVSNNTQFINGPR